LGRRNTRGSTEMPDHFLFRGRIKVIRSPVKRKDLGASPSLGATLRRRAPSSRAVGLSSRISSGCKSRRRCQAMPVKRISRLVALSRRIQPERNRPRVPMDSNPQKTGNGLLIRHGEVATTSDHLIAPWRNTSAVGFDPTGHRGIR
jgi:hypothetical protein